MKRLFCFYILILSLGSGCKDDQFDLSKDPLDGTIGGSAWNYRSGGASVNIFTTDIEAILISDETRDACSIVNTVRPHITMTFPARRGNYTLSVDEVEVIFNLEGGTVKYNAPGGFIQVVSIDGTEIIGFLSAEWDDNNTVEGSFLLDVCN